MFFTLVLALGIEIAAQKLRRKYPHKDSWTSSIGIGKSSLQPVAFHLSLSHKVAKTVDLLKQASAYSL
ncbi:hypothetical protein A1OO_04820 [Enterovibrio norvegicus FF-33]|uniref:Uncharacterized protein n=2 Tax=Enterovibrio norvegicus TaxID=188144 RepID=A0A1E5CB41_9GAMM|nr:hypothetical protein A1OK_19240 [Enterovibrio norvegicus FF-454]OEE70102.1 hypothetical protein A1OO_04820 [Enterovibrio norvegicus FF-33]OEE86195.1 hypothetical protein A1OQ_17185 [Enterovibrio norvegicus FF-162]